MKKGFATLEIVLALAVFAVLLGLTVPKFFKLIDKAYEGSTKHHLVRLRTAVVAYYGENQGVYPTDDLSSLVPTYIEAIPSVHIAGSAATNRVNAGDYETAFDNTGGWAYVNDPEDPHFGDVFVNSNQADSYGTPWNTH